MSRTRAQKQSDVDLDRLLAEITPNNAHPEIDFGTLSRCRETRQCSTTDILVTTEHVTPTGTNIFTELGQPDAESLRVKAILMSEITQIWRDCGLDKNQMAKKLGTTPTCFNDILNERVEKCSIARMIDMLGSVGKQVSLTVSCIDEAVR